MQALAEPRPTLMAHCLLLFVRRNLMKYAFDSALNRSCTMARVLAGAVCILNKAGDCSRWLLSVIDRRNTRHNAASVMS